MKKKFRVVKNFKIVKRSCSLNRYYRVLEIVLNFIQKCPVSTKEKNKRLPWSWHSSQLSNCVHECPSQVQCSQLWMILKITLNESIICRNDDLSSTMSRVGCLLKYSELFILFSENSQILSKISVIPILLTFMYLVALNLLVNNQLNSSLRQVIDS